ncbi:MAG: P-II family nitrogen regulator [Sporomusaceae bacterium]|jgi:nitrogen regulatory protein PII|nr:P-II family nitrogen regulator [Sporomusaceae bacterium]
MSDCPKEIKFELIVVIVNKGISADVIDAGKSAGAQGATVLRGRGSGIHEQAKFFGIVIEPEKEVVLILVDNKIRDNVLDSISQAIEIEKPGHGIAFVVEVPKVIGIPHLTK